MAAVTALVADYQQALERETLLLARDPAVVEGTAKGDWATLARGASPRVLAVTQDGLADFIAIRDGRVHEYQVTLNVGAKME